MRVRILTEDLNSLYAWLRADAELARTAQVRFAPPAPGSMGALDVVDVVLTHVTALSSLAVSVFTWRASRPGNSPVTVVRDDGRRLTVDGPPEVTAEVISEFLAGDDTDGDTRPPAS